MGDTAMENRAYSRLELPPPKQKQPVNWKELRQKINHYKVVFEHHDDTKDGFLTPKQFEAVCTELDIQVNSEQYSNIFADGRASFGELIEVCLVADGDPAMKLLDFDKMRDAFNSLDTNGDGVLDEDEFSRCWKGDFEPPQYLMPNAEKHVTFSDFVDYQVFRRKSALSMDIESFRMSQESDEPPQGCFGGCCQNCVCIIL